MRAANQEGGLLMWMMPMHLHVNKKKSDYDDMIMPMLINPSQSFVLI